ncbi:MAG: glycosyl hydrolase [Legionella sp.]|nr:MAG: glycosyl hydrolase [Legionella sp.]PJD99677.1 MAG: glycosyl hydrolase [Legionella sp.]
MIPLRKKIGQLLIMGFDGAVVNEDSLVSHWLRKDGLGGVLLFDKDWSTGDYGKNLQNREQIKLLIQQLNECAQQVFPEMPLLTAIDYEGGAVDRLKSIKGCMTTLDARALAKLDEQELKNQLEQMAQTLSTLGFNLNFAPVVDLNLNEEKGIIGKLDRSYSANPQEVIRVARQFVDVFAQHGIACSYKHFPGHGSATGDTHEGFVDVTEHFNHQELIPYASLVQDKDKPVMIMTAHVINKVLDETGLPATLSYKILTTVLRDTLGYDGIIISDDLQMQAIAHHYSLEDSLALTFNAGADMVIFGNQLGFISATDVIDCIEQLVLCKKIPMHRIDEAYQRVMRLKQHIKKKELVI